MAAFYTFEDLSGGKNTPTTSENPYDGLIEACNNDCTAIQARYSTHRTARNAQQREKLLGADFAGVSVDEVLAKLEDPTIEPGFKDWRHCLVFWARPPQSVRDLIGEVQKKLLAVAPTSKIDELVRQILPGSSEIVDYTHNHQARLVKPLVSFDAQALALSFLPAAGEPGRSRQKDGYSYHHLRRDLYTKVSATSVKVASRYVIPSAHLTIARFVTKKDFETADGTVDHARVQKLVDTIEEVNAWLREEYWPKSDGIKEGGEWVVGQDKGLDFKHGALWYGGGETVTLGKGF
ncbi:hypothetical protein LTR78_010214 [Recurvomyces mirabilis]|uniref:Uncharacterized protein n=1 Tax=Recurvomyces mirabilis TaxID=574656 RepID=A0AAE0TQV1_9PEZI|nr:hypothetical protein LTR78_010214 [Recurvomyces mirabilis]KAK5149680.1 hypothetical protein LTS14_010741 [Recurvomyces mirabilis]